MTSLTRRAALMVAAGAFLAGCDTTRSKSSGDMSPDDLDFVANAYNIIEFDRQECGLAQTEARSPEVRALAAQLLKNANDFDARLAPIAASAGIKPPTALRTNLRVRVGHLRLNQGFGFDRSFVEDQIVSHQDAINLQENMLSTTGGNPQLKQLASDSTAILRTNLAKLHDLQKKMMLSPAGRV